MYNLDFREKKERMEERNACTICKTLYVLTSLSLLYHINKAVVKSNHDGENNNTSKLVLKTNLAVSTCPFCSLCRGIHIKCLCISKELSFGQCLDHQ